MPLRCVTSVDLGLNDDVHLQHLHNDCVAGIRNRHSGKLGSAELHDCLICCASATESKVA